MYTSGVDHEEDHAEVGRSSTRNGGDSAQTAEATKTWAKTLGRPPAPRRSTSHPVSLFHTANAPRNHYQGTAMCGLLARNFAHSCCLSRQVQLEPKRQTTRRWDPESIRKQETPQKNRIQPKPARERQAAHSKAARIPLSTGHPLERAGRSMKRADRENAEGRCGDHATRSHPPQQRREADSYVWITKAASGQ